MFSTIFALLVSMATARKTKRHISHDGTIREYDYESHQWTVVETPESPDSNQEEKECLALEGRIFDVIQHFPYLYRKEEIEITSRDSFEGEFRINGLPLYIGSPINNGLKQRQSADAEHGDTGNTVWDSSMALTKCIEHHSNDSIDGNQLLNVSGRTVLELGSGTGFVGLSALLCGAQRVLLSDLEYCTENIRRNVAKNQLLWSLWNDENEEQKEHKLQIPKGKVSVIAVDWLNHKKSLSDFKGTIDVVIGSDVIWIKELVPALTDTLQYIHSNFMDEDGIIIIAEQIRSKKVSELFWNLMESKGFKRTILPQELFHPDFRSNKISINVLAKAKFESH